MYIAKLIKEVFFPMGTVFTFLKVLSYKQGYLKRTVNITRIHSTDLPTWNFLYNMCLLFDYFFYMLLEKKSLGNR